MTRIVVEHGRARHRREGVARIVIALLGVLERIEHPGRITNRAREDAGPVNMDIRADRTPVKSEQCLVREDERDRIVIGRPAAGRTRFLAHAAHHHVGGHGNARAGA